MTNVVKMSRKHVDPTGGKGHSRHASRFASGVLFSEVAKQGSEMRLIAGPCLLESVDHGWRMAEALAEIATDLHIDFFMFKASFRKANRTKWDSTRGCVGVGEAKALFERISKTFGYPCITDVHSWEDTDIWRSLGCLQVPALLSRQSEIIESAAEAGTIHIKKGQFMAPHDVKWAVEKARIANPDCYVMVSERGYSFGYNNLVVDMRSFPILREIADDYDEVEILFDCTHSVQLPGALGKSSGGQREYIEPLARAALAAGADGLFCEVHDDPADALSDGPCQIPLKHFAEFLKPLLELHAWATENPFKSLEP